MKQSLAYIWMLSFAVGCKTSSDPATGLGQAAGATGIAGSAGSAGSAGTKAGDAAGSTAGGGRGSGGAPSGGSGGTSSSSAGTPGTGAGAGAPSSAGTTGTAFKCPAGPFPAPALSGAMATKVAAPPADAFNKDQFTVVEGPVWIGDSLYFSELGSSNMIPPARLLKLGPGNVVSVISPDSGSNGLAVDAAGNLFAAVHKDGSISEVALPSGMETALVHTYGTAPRFNSPNDLAIRSDGTIYFSDPTFQNSANPQMAERLYRVTPGPTRTVSIATNPSDTAYLSPNGVTFSPDEQTLYVSGSTLKKFPVMTDGTLGVSSDFVTGGSPGTSLDGMGMDCAGNLYVAGNNSSAVNVYSPAGALLGTVTSIGGTSSNVAFGGADHKTLYITALGTEGARGIYSVALNVPGFPY